jgi:cation:H+ antiporter
MVHAVVALGSFTVGVALAIWATERLLVGLVGVAIALRLSAFVLGAMLSGLEVENLAVGLAAGARQVAPVALGTVYGGAIFLVCVALGLGAVIAPLEVRLPRGILLLFALTPLLAGLGLLAPVIPRWAGLLLLLAFVGMMSYLVLRAGRYHGVLASPEVEEAQRSVQGSSAEGARWSLWRPVGLTVLGLVVVSVGGELVARGAEGIIAALDVPARFMGMIVAPAAIELEEVVRQAVPARRGRPEVSAGNLVGTLLYVLLFNLGLIALLTPVRIDRLVRTLDWPILLGVTFLAVVLLWRGRVGRRAGGVLVAVYGAYVLAHVVVR